MDEARLIEDRNWLHERHAQTVIMNLQKRKMNGQYVANRKEALTAILAMIPPGALVSHGGSMTLEQTGVFPALEERNQNKLLDVSKKTASGSFVYSKEERQRMMRETFFCDVFLTGCNAITLDGKLVNIDGLGNRVASMIFGPGKVIVVAGANKIVRDAATGLERIRQIAAPLTALRRNRQEEPHDLPCLKTGVCVDCNSDWRICQNTVIIEGCVSLESGRINVVLVGEELGY